MEWILRHEMVLEVTPGTQIWMCPECGKRVRVYPDYKVLVRGDQGLCILGVRVV